MSKQKRIQNKRALALKKTNFALIFLVFGNFIMIKPTLLQFSCTGGRILCHENIFFAKKNSFFAFITELLQATMKQIVPNPYSKMAILKVKRFIVLIFQ